MTESLLRGFGPVLDPQLWLAVAAAIPIGLLVGILPGISGLTALALLLPTVYNMNPVAGLGFLLATHAVVYTGGSVTAILLGIPGEPANAATILDGHPLSRRGRGGYALGAALAASAFGGVIGAVLLMLLLPFLRPLAMAVGAAETFALALSGVLCVALLTQGAPLKGLIAAGLGVFMATFGYQRITGVPRFWFGGDYLLDGFRLVPLVLGLFAVPEVLDMASAPSSKSTAGVSRRQLMRGAGAVFARTWLTVRSALIGVYVGIIPGVGGATAPFLAYALAKRTARRPGRFGKGALDGVIAPESSNNAKEGGALVPTLALGIPGSASMAVLLGGFQVLGLDPGPGFLARHTPLAVSLCVVLAVANIGAALGAFALARPVSALLQLRGRILAPWLLVLVVLGAFATNNDPTDVVFVFVFGGLGLAMRALDYSRPALLLGFVMAPLLETYLHIALQAYGFAFMLRPSFLAIIGITLLAAAWPIFANSWRKRSPR